MTNNEIIDAVLRMESEDWDAGAFQPVLDVENRTTGRRVMPAAMPTPATAPVTTGA